MSVRRPDETVERAPTSTSWPLVYALAGMQLVVTLGWMAYAQFQPQLLRLFGLSAFATPLAVYIGFTGATQSKPGHLEQAAGGILFLDEVAEMSVAAQAKFLRVLQEHEFQRLGGTRVLKTDARIVAATNRDLHRAMKRGNFRADLYYRLNVFAIRIPPLRERREDVLPLTEAFIREFGLTIGRPPAGVSREARDTLLGRRQRRDRGLDALEQRGHCSSDQAQPSRATIALEAAGPQVPAA